LRMQGTRKARMLIVDDSPETLAGLNCYYSARFEVLTASDAGEVLRVLEASAPKVDVLICDLLIPGASGAGLIAHIKARFPDLPVIVITGWDLNPERLAAATGADGVLFKPFEMEALDEAVGRLLKRRG